MRIFTPAQTELTHNADQSATDDCLPSEVEQLLVDVVTDGFVIYCCGPRAEPTALVACYHWEHYVDLVIIRCFDRITAARVPRPLHGRVDIFAPQEVVWANEGPPQQVLRALLDLGHPHHPQAPTSTFSAPPSLYIPRAEQRPMTIRFPSAQRAGVRAARFTAGAPSACYKQESPAIA